jgi:hypothetical protein
VHGTSKPLNLTGLALRLAARLRWHPGSHGLELRASSDLSLVPPQCLVSPQCEFDSVADQANPGCEALDGANRAAGVPGLWSTRDDLTLRFNEDHVDNTEIMNFELPLSLLGDGFASKKLCIVMNCCRVNAS